MNLYGKAVAELDAIPRFPPPGRLNTACMEAALAETGGLGCGRAQIIGSNGKGSTSFFVSRIIAAHGIRCGLYTSPHLVSPCERIAVGGKAITPAQFGRLYFTLKPVFEKHGLTHFERLTLMACDFFKRQKTGFTVLETGLGGEHDAVSAFRSPCLVFTTISLEHRDVLGNSLSAIARTKAAPLKFCRRAFSCRQPQTAGRILKNTAARAGAELSFSPKPRRVRLSVRGTEFEYRGHNLRIPMFGGIYAENGCLALEAAQYLLGNNFSFPKAAKALAGAFWAGRLEIVRLKNCNPALFSCAHNEQSLDADLAVIKQLVRLEIIPPPGKVIFAVSGNRDAAGFLKKVSAAFPDITAAKIPGHAKPFEQLKKTGAHCTEDCAALVRRLIGPKPAEKNFVLVIGSIYLAGLVLETLQDVGAVRKR
ncbi:MAG: hypothetical protein WC421_01855 [Elusimicrobiales bacterium]